jgi:hypothetical protein
MIMILMSASCKNATITGIDRRLHLPGWGSIKILAFLLLNHNFSGVRHEIDLCFCQLISIYFLSKEDITIRFWFLHLHQMPY